MVGDSGGRTGLRPHRAAVARARPARGARVGRAARDGRARGRARPALARRGHAVSRGRPGRPGRATTPAAPAPALPLRHPAMIDALAVALAGVAASVTFVLFETDVWQHLLVGKAIWSLGHVPTTQLWTWSSYGDPEVNSAWLFRVIIWKVWSWGGVWGLQIWRWVTTLAAFALLWATARRLGARGFAAVPVMIACVLVYRLRSQIRPETLASVYLALALWILETRRRKRAGDATAADRTAWLPVLALAWANTHISYFLGFALLGIHWLDEQVAAWRGDRAARPNRLLVIGVVSVLASLINPFGWRALVQPFDFALHWRNEPMFTSIGELQHLPLVALLWNGVPFVMVLWPLLLVWRALRRGPDLAETLSFVFFAAIAWSSMRFLGYVSLVAVPYLARDLDDWVAARRWPVWSASPWVRAGLVGAACMALGWRAWTAPVAGIGVGIDERYVPVRAADWIQANDVRGRMFNHFHFGGYLLYRFWPDRGRLPFARIHPEALRREDRLGYEAARTDPAGWYALDQRHRFDYAVLYRRQLGGDVVLDVLDADPGWALVFVDDVAAIYVRRDGPLAPLAERFAYRTTPAGKRAIAAFGRAVSADTALRARAESELRRQIAGSKWNAMSGSLLANLELMDGRT